MIRFTGERCVPQIDGSIKYEHLHRYALALDFAKGCSVLDIASGEGYGSALLAERAAYVIGVDIDIESVNHAQAQYGHLANLKFLTGSCSAIPVADASIDVVTSFETIEHHDQHEEMMQEIKRVLKADGLLIISSPNRLVYSDELNHINQFHVKELCYEELLDLLKRYFQQVHIYGQKLAVSSCVTSLEPSSTKEVKSFSGGFNSLSNAAASLPSPLYFVAICSNREEFLLETLESIYLDSSDDLLTQLQNDRHAGQLALQQLQQAFQQHQADSGAVKQELVEAHGHLQELAHVQEDCEHLKTKLEAVHQEIAAMESSKFWKLRQIWIRFKQSLLKR